MNELFEKILNESKDHLIKKKAHLINSQKDELMKWLAKFPELEKLVDWNKEFIGNEDYAIVKRSFDQKMSTYKHGKNLLEPFYNMIDSEMVEVHKKTNNTIYISPLCYQAAVFMNSYNCYGIGAKWCIGTRGNQNWWSDYNNRNNSFIMYYNANSKTKRMIQYNPFERESASQVVTLWDEEDNVVIINEKELMIDIDNDLEGLDIIANEVEATSEELLKWFDNLKDCNIIYDTDEEDD